MTVETRTRQTVARKANVDIYASGASGRFYWPFRLQPADTARQSARQNCDQFVLDSGFTPGPDAGIGTETLLDKVSAYDPTYVIPNDAIALSDPPEGVPALSQREAITSTAEQTAAFLNAVDEQNISATVIVPLQPPHDLHYRYLEVEYPRQAARAHFAVGGLKDATGDEQVAAIKRLRDEIGYEPYLHGFGLGASRSLIMAVRNDPALIDSVDFSTPIRHGKNGQVAGRSRNPVDVNPAAGGDVSTTAMALAVAELTDIARMCAPSLTSEDDITVGSPDSEDQTDVSESEDDKPTRVTASTADSQQQSRSTEWDSQTTTGQLSLDSLQAETN